MKNILIKLDHTKKYIINDHKKFDTWKTQLTIAINSISSEDNGKKRVMHLKTDDIEIMINDKADEVIEKRFESLLNIYQIGLEKSIRGSDFFFDRDHLLYYKCHKINFKRSGPYV